jgi:hypothetical protein
MLAFDFEPGVKAWRRACAAQGWHWTREQYATPSGDAEGPLEPIAKDLAGSRMREGPDSSVTPHQWAWSRARLATRFHPFQQHDEQAETHHQDHDRQDDDDGADGIGGDGWH